jgi:hypothetical protein
MPDKPMADRKKTGKAAQADQRQTRLAAQLRSNLKKRRQQARERAGSDDPATISKGSDEEGRP